MAERDAVTVRGLKPCQAICYVVRGTEGGGKFENLSYHTCFNQRRGNDRSVSVDIHVVTPADRIIAEQYR